MKTFIYTITETKVSRIYGGSTQTAKIYRVKNNKPEFLCYAKWCTRAYKGEKYEVQTTLADKGYLPEKYTDKKHTSYYERYKEEEQGFRILSV